MSAVLLFALAGVVAMAFGSLIFWLDRKIEVATETRENIRARLEI